MKALSLTQPWATAIALGVKQWETRSWATGFRGEVCIHASKGFPKWAKEFAYEMRNAGELDFETLPLGEIVCVCNITECRSTETAEVSDAERQWGDYSVGRYCFKLENVRLLATPISATGHLGFWPVLPEQASAVTLELNKLGK